MIIRLLEMSVLSIAFDFWTVLPYLATIFSVFNMTNLIVLLSILSFQDWHTR